MLRRCLSLAIVFALLLLLQASGGAQDATKWTNPDGKELVGEFVRMEGKAVVLRLENGKEAKVPLTNLSLESHLQALKLAKPEAFNKEVVKAPVAVEAAQLTFKIAPSAALTSPFEDDPKIDSFLKTFTDELNKGNLFVAWHMMPPKMQTDMSAFLSKNLQGLGPSAPSQLRRVFTYLASIASKKRDWLLDPVVTGQPMTPEQLAQAEQAWPYIVSFLEGVADPSIWEPSSFQQEKIPTFLASFLVNFQYLAELDKDPSKAWSYVVVSESADRAEVKFKVNGQELPPAQFQKVGKIWVVPELMIEIRGFLDKSANAPPNPMVTTGFGGFMAVGLPVLGKLDQAKTKEEFKKTLEALTGQMKKLPPGAAPSGPPQIPSWIPGFGSLPGQPAPPPGK